MKTNILNADCIISVDYTCTDYMLYNRYLYFIPLVNRNWGQYIEAEIRNFPAVTEWTTRLTRYLLSGLCSSIVKKNTIKNTSSRCGPIRSSILYRSISMLGKVNIFLSVIEKIDVCCRYFWLFLPIALVAFTHNSTEPVKPRCPPSLQDNLVRSDRSVRTITVAI